jgi:hypothetical protein
MSSPGITRSILKLQVLELVLSLVRDLGFLAAEIEVKISQNTST